MYALLAAVTLAAYWNSFGLGIALDGHPLLADPRTHAFTAENLRLILTKTYWWPAPVDRLYRPLTTLSFLAAGDPAFCHALNFLLHAINVCLVFALALRLLRDRTPAFFAAALWAVHPAGTEAVANLAGRADLLAAGGILGGLLVYDRVIRDGARAGLVAAIFALAAGAVFAKENGAMLLAAMLLWDLTRGFGGRPGLRRRLPAYTAVGLALALYGLARMRVMSGLPWPVEAFVDNPLRGAGFWAARWTAVKIFGLHLWLLLFPVALSADRSYAQIPTAGPLDWGAWASLIVVAFALAAAIQFRKRQPVWFWCAGFFGLMLLPVSNLVVLIGSPSADRFLYLPSAAFAVAAAAACYRWARPNAPWILGALCVLLAARTLARNPDWNDDLSLMSHDAAVAPASFRVRETYGEYLFDRDPRKLEQAIAEVEAAWKILEPLPPERNVAQVPPILAMLYGVKAERAGMATPEGRAWLEKALALLLRADEISRAGEREFDRAQQLHGKPLAMRRGYYEAYQLLGLTYAALGRTADALVAYRYARGIDPLADKGYDGAIAVADPTRAAVLSLEKQLAHGMQPPAGDPNLCPAVRELAETFHDARQPARAQELQNACAP
jgi:hypothetical protein